MKSSSKQNILKKIKQALEKPVPLPFEKASAANRLFATTPTDLEILFAENFTELQGRFSFCANEAELIQQLQSLFNARQWKNIFVNETKLKEIFAGNNLDVNQNIPLADCDAAVTTCENLVARTGSIVLSSVQNGRTSSVYAPVHICVAYTNQLVFDLQNAFESLTQKYASAFPSLITFASGPSRTADIEKTLVTGVHGPKEVFCFLIESQ